MTIRPLEHPVQFTVRDGLRIAIHPTGVFVGRPNERRWYGPVAWDRVLIRAIANGEAPAAVHHLLAHSPGLDGKAHRSNRTG